MGSPDQLGYVSLVAGVGMVVTYLPSGPQSYLLSKEQGGQDI